MAASSRLNMGLLRSAIAGRLQIRSLQTLSCSHIKSVQLQRLSTKRSSSNLGQIPAIKWCVATNLQVRKELSTYGLKFILYRISKAKSQ